MELIPDEHGKLHFKAAVQLSPTFFGWCLSFGDKLQVIGPDDMVAKVTDYIQSLMDGYRKDREDNDMRDREPSLLDVLFGTPKKKGKEKKLNIFDDDWEERCSECMSITKIANARIALTMTAETREAEDKR